MVLGTKQKEMLFILGKFFNETAKRFSTTVLKLSISKAEFIDNIDAIGILSKKERAMYRNLEALEKEKYILYDKSRNLMISRKGNKEYEKLLSELEFYNTVASKITPENIKFRRKQQTKLKY